MDVGTLRASAILSTTTAFQPEYANRTPALRARSLPLSGMYEYKQASFWLDGIFLSMAQRWPSVTDGIVDGNRTMVCIGLHDPEALTVNGEVIRFPAITIGRKGAEYRVAEEAPWTSVITMFPTDTQDRDWPESGLMHNIVPVSDESLAAIRHILWDIFSVASFAPERFLMPGIVTSMADTIYAAFDHAFLSKRPISITGSRENHFNSARQISEYIRNNIHKQIYSDDIANYLNLTPRTLHNIMKINFGMSLHKYLRLQRLWMVRSKLLEARPGTPVKQIALDHGFWHLGRFSIDYNVQFGESPSATLQRVA